MIVRGRALYTAVKMFRREKTAFDLSVGKTRSFGPVEACGPSSHKIVSYGAPWYVAALGYLSFGKTTGMF